MSETDDDVKKLIYFQLSNTVIETKIIIKGLTHIYANPSAQKYVCYAILLQ